MYESVAAVRHKKPSFKLGGWRTGICFFAGKDSTRAPDRRLHGARGCTAWRHAMRLPAPRRCTACRQQAGAGLPAGLVQEW